MTSYLCTRNTIGHCWEYQTAQDTCAIDNHDSGYLGMAVQLYV